jgi:hypothetical protein
VERCRSGAMIRSAGPRCEGVRRDGRRQWGGSSARRARAGVEGAHPDPTGPGSSISPLERPRARCRLREGRSDGGRPLRPASGLRGRKRPVHERDLLPAVGPCSPGESFGPRFVSNLGWRRTSGPGAGREHRWPCKGWRVTRTR